MCSNLELPVIVLSLLPLKDNQPGIYESVAVFLDTAETNSSEYFTI